MHHFEKLKSKANSVKSQFFLGFANFIPNFIKLGIIKSFFLILAGVKLKSGKTYFKSPIAIDSPQNIQIGKNVFINRNVYFEGEGRVEIKNFCHIGPSVVFATTRHDINNSMSSIIGEITIAENVWIGSNCTILSNLTIGPNVVVAAGSVVTKSFKNAVIAGVPAKIIN